MVQDFRHSHKSILITVSSNNIKLGARGFKCRPLKVVQDFFHQQWFTPRFDCLSMLIIELLSYPPFSNKSGHQLRNSPFSDTPMWWNESGFIPRGLLRFTHRKCGNWITLPSADFPWGYLDVPSAHALEKELSDRLGLYLKCDFFEWITWQKLVPLILTCQLLHSMGRRPV